MDFHHRDPTKKDLDVGKLLHGNSVASLGKYKSELDKCVLLCRNCHGEIHANDGQFLVGAHKPDLPSKGN
jgi:hypothetical protein